ncbi:putative Endonuclease/exonuclease/phosphatase superfamily [Helianthus debilis subsp. tardiflorus]
MMGCNFTYMTDNGRKFSKIDRILVSFSFLSQWPAAQCFGLQRYKSDHRPLLLLCSDISFGAPPFRFFNSWIKEDGFSDLIRKVYVGVAPFYPPDKLMAARLKAIKATIKTWCDERNKRNNGLLLDLKKKVEILDLKAESFNLSETEIKNREVWVNTINELDEIRSEDQRQRAKIKWAVEGDESSSFFHGIIKGHQKNNRINGLNFNHVWVSQPDELKSAIKAHFETLFQEIPQARLRFVNDGFKVLDLP